MNDLTKELAREIALALKDLQTNALMNELIIDALVSNASNRAAVLVSIDASLSSLKRGGSTQHSTDSGVIAALTKWLAARQPDPAHRSD